MASKFAKELVDTKEKKVKRFIGGLQPINEEQVVMYKRPDTFKVAVDRVYTAEEMTMKKRIADPKKGFVQTGKGFQQKRQMGVVIGAPKCNSCGK